jgi:hypothetical protein
MENLPLYITIIFDFITLVTVLLFFKATNYSRPVIFLLVLWLVLQGLISLTGFYTVSNTIPPRFILLVLPPLVVIATLFFTLKGKVFIDSLDIKTLTLLHTIRIAVEIILFLVFLQKGIPGIMTFEGRNFDIISGLTAPFIYYFGFIKKQLNEKIIAAWNIVCLVLLINIVITAILSAPFAFQKLAFEQPNVAILYFPFVWLPCCIVPIVLFSHLVAIRRFITNRKNKSYQIMAREY